MSEQSQYQTSRFFPQPFAAVQTGVLQRKCSCGTHTIAGDKCDECKNEGGAVQRKPSNFTEHKQAPPIVHEVLQSPGQALDTNTRSTFETSFTQIPISSVSGQLSQSSLTIGDASDRYEQEADRVADSIMTKEKSSDKTLSSNEQQNGKFDLSQVRIHTGAKAAESAREINALAYTLGNSIVFGAGQFAPATREGRKLIAHELTHVAQQSGNISPKIQRQPGADEEEPASELAKKLKEDSLFQKLKKAARDKILKEIDNAPETITKFVFDKIIDSAPIEQAYKDGLKKVGEALIKQLTGKKTPSTSICDIPGYYEGKSRAHKGMCCWGTFESAATCCSKDKFAPGDSRVCCQANEFVNANNKCEKHSSTIPETICESPGKKDIFGKCCKPPMEVIDGMCMTKPTPEPPAQPFSLKFTLGVIDDYDIDSSILNSRQKPRFEEMKKQIHQFMEACPASMVTVVGFADRPGTEEHNQTLGQRRADYIKFLLQLDLIKINSKGMPPLIFARSEGESNPVDPAAGEKFSAKNRRVEIEFNSMCPPLGSPSLTQSLTDRRFR